MEHANMNFEENRNRPFMSFPYSKAFDSAVC